MNDTRDEIEEGGVEEIRGIADEEGEEFDEEDAEDLDQEEDEEA